MGLAFDSSFIFKQMPLVPATWSPGAMFPDAHWAPTDCLQPKIPLTAISHHTWITTGIQMALSQVTLVPQLSINQRIDKASFYMFLLCGYPQRSTIVVSSHFGCHPSREMLHQLAHTFFLVPTTSGLLWPVGRPGDTAAWDWEGLPILCFQRPAPFHQDCWKPMCLKTRHAYKKNGNRMANTCKYKDQIW